jgi:glycosyltransferase involved in cell wall biosynthesis
MRKIHKVTASRPLRILVLGLEGPVTGGAYTAENLMLEQIREAAGKHEIFLMRDLLNQSRLPQFFYEKICKIEKILAITLSSPLFYRLSLKLKRGWKTLLQKNLDKLSVDLVIFVGIYDDAILLNGTPYFVTIWDIGHRELTFLPEMSRNATFEWREWVITHLAKKATGVFVESNVTKENLVTLYGIREHNIHILPFVPTFTDKLPPASREDFVFYPAHFWSHKNHSVLLKAMHYLINQGVSPRRLVLTGLDRGSKKHFLNVAEELGLLGFIDDKGFLKDAEIKALYRSAAVTAMPSVLGPTNLPPLESLLEGCPVVVSASGNFDVKGLVGSQSLDPYDFQAWSVVFDKRVPLPKVSVKSIRNRMLHGREHNLLQIKLILEDFHVKRELY